MTLTEHEHPEWEDMVKTSLHRIGGVWTSLTDKGVREYLKALDDCTAEGIDKAISLLINADEPLRYRPRPGEIRAAIPGKYMASSRDSAILGWWHTDGSFGGDWTGVPKKRLDQILTDVLACIQRQPGELVEERRKLLEHLRRLGAQDPQPELVKA